jgi:phosphopantothenoylcysteine decarboxylase/phosphopantothenate--cysteine ligase
MLEPDEIVAAVTAPIAVRDVTPRALSGKTVMITAGPTREAIDPVRYISNRSSGKMGFALADAARLAGARVLLISGPVSITAPEGVERIDVESAKEMFAATHERIDEVDIFIGAAAVADYHPADAHSSKIKKSTDELSIELVKNPDILSSVARLHNGPFTVGFAAETEGLNEYARDKLVKKKMNMIVANLVGKDLGFDVDQNAAEVFWPNGHRSFPLANKRQLAEDLVGLISELYSQSFSTDTQTELPTIMVRD